MRADRKAAASVDDWGGGNDYQIVGAEQASRGTIKCAYGVVASNREDGDRNLVNQQAKQGEFRSLGIIGPNACEHPRWRLADYGDDRESTRGNSKKAR
jgi:hypothetical protein